MSERVVLVDAVRSPFGKAGSLYAQTRADDIMVRTLRGLLERNPKISPSAIDDVAIAAATREVMSHEPRSCALLFRAFRLRSSHRFIRGWGTKWMRQLRLACMHARPLIAPRVTVC
jgi:acetyl-CoA acetyltransferase